MQDDAVSSELENDQRIGLVSQGLGLLTVLGAGAVTCLFLWLWEALPLPRLSEDDAVGVVVLTLLAMLATAIFAVPGLVLGVVGLCCDRPRRRACWGLAVNVLAALWVAGLVFVNVCVIYR